MSNVFDIKNFNIIEDEENYYFFRALNNEDNQDLESEKIIDETGKIAEIRTDRQRYEENHENGKAKYDKEAKISLEEVYDHIKTYYRRDTNCISLSSNANVSILYGRGKYKDQYIMVKVPKKEYGEKVINAGQYLLEEIEKKVDEYIQQENIDSDLAETLSEIDQSKTSNEIKGIIEERYTSEQLDPSRAKLRKGIRYKAPIARIGNYQALTNEQTLEKNKIIAKLTLLEKIGGMQPIIPHTANNNSLIQTVGNAFSSLELIHYGTINQEEIINVPKEIIDIFAILQQVEGQDEPKIENLKKEIIQFAKENKKIKIPQDSILQEDYKELEDLSIEEIYELTKGKVEYGIANSTIKKIFYLAKSQSNAKEFAKILENITGNNQKYKQIIEYIVKNGFRVEPNITTNRSNRNAQISESISFDFDDEEIELIERIKELSQEEQIKLIEKINELSQKEQAKMLEKGGVSNVNNINIKS